MIRVTFVNIRDRYRWHNLIMTFADSVSAASVRLPWSVTPPPYKPHRLIDPILRPARAITPERYEFVT